MEANARIEKIQMATCTDHDEGLVHATAMTKNNLTFLENAINKFLLVHRWVELEVHEWS